MKRQQRITRTFNDAYVKWLLLLVLAVTICQVRGQGKSFTRKPNIVFILADDLGYADLGCYGNPYIKTPNIDALSRLGIRFTQAYAASPVCSPSRAAILTAKHPARFPLTNYLEGRKGDTSSSIHPAIFLDSLPANEYTLSKALKMEGYTTGMVGKWHLGAADISQPIHFGFDFERVADNRIFYYDFKLRSANRVVYESKENENLTDCLTREAVNFIEQNKDKPFFLYLAHFAPHLVLQPKPQKLPRYYFTYNSLSQGRYDPQYAATIETLDDNIGILLKKLDSLRLMENTIIVFTSDNGGVSSKELGVKPTDNSPLREGKGFVYEGGIRIPLLMVWQKQIPSNKIIGQKILNTDFFPTFLDIIASKQRLTGIDGRSFVKVWKDDFADTANRIMYWHYPHFSNQGGRPAAAIRQGDYKLIESYETGKRELYNLREDVGEKTNLAGRLPELTKQLATLLDNWRKEVSANMPTPRN